MSRNNNYTKQIIDNYCVIDTETTGLSPYYDEVLEVSILRVRNNEIVSKYSQLVEPQYPIPYFITQLTGITNEMVAGKPKISDIENDVLSFIGTDIIIGHNTSFDISFLNASFEKSIDNQYMDTCQFCRKVYPELEHHRLSDMTEYLKISTNEHRALADCISTKELYDCIKKSMSDQGLTISDLWASRKGKGGKGIDIHSIQPTSIHIDEDSFFFNKHVVFTGKLDKMLRKDAMQIIVNLGGILDSSVSKKTNYLILGDNDYNAILHGEKSSKHKKAEELKLAGYDIEIIDELTFYDIINEDITRASDYAEDTSIDEEECVTIEDDSVNDWRYYTRQMLDELVLEYGLPDSTMLMSDNKSKKNPKLTISHTIYIWEPDYPIVNKSPEQNMIILTVALSTVKSRPNDIDLYIRQTQFDDLQEYLPNDADVLPQTKTDIETRTIRVRFDKDSKTLLQYIGKNVRYCVEHYKSKADGFGCCSKFKDCSDARKCLHDNLLYSKACAYRANLENGHIFY